MLIEKQAGLSVELMARLAEGRDETDQLFRILTQYALYERPIPERHRIIFYIGHLEAFDWNLLKTHLNLDSFNPTFDRLFAFGIDPVGGGLPSDQPADWPSHREVSSYRKQVRQELNSALALATESEELSLLMNIAIEHRLMHAETLEYMFHQLPYEFKVRPEKYSPGEAKVTVSPAMVKIHADTVTLGLRRNSGQFGWDNEFEAHSVDVPQFLIDRYKVTNSEFHEFIRDGGYQKRALWTDVDWSWKESARVEHPVFWVPTGNGFHYRGMFEELPLTLNAPVYVSHAEASAFARWAGKELPSEAEWLLAAEGARVPPNARELWDPPQVGSTGDPIDGMYGTGWEWTASEFRPFGGFQAVPAYPGYSADFFDGRHFVMKGGSPRTAACLMRKSFRNWFQAHYQYVYAGFRCVKH